MVVQGRGSCISQQDANWVNQATPSQPREGSSSYIIWFLWPLKVEELWPRLSGETKHESKQALYAQYCSQWEGCCLLIPATQDATPSRAQWAVGLTAIRGGFRYVSRQVEGGLQAGGVGTVTVWCFTKLEASSWTVCRCSSHCLPLLVVLLSSPKRMVAQEYAPLVHVLPDNHGDTLPLHMVTRAEVNRQMIHLK